MGEKFNFNQAVNEIFNFYEKNVIHFIILEVIRDAGLQIIWINIIKKLILSPLLTE